MKESSSLCRGLLRTAAIVSLSLVFALGIAPAKLSADPATVARQLERSRDRYSTLATWKQRQAALHQAFLEGARLWPLPERGAVQAIAHSKREYDGYSVENVALETVPGFFCTGNLYRPAKQQSPGPGILCPHGHFRPLGRFREDQQIRCAHLARMGATVFSYSMVGWQDSQQTTHDDPLVLALQTWNSLRALDYLANLPGVDPQRLAVTGASGGGTQTFYLAFLDPRIKASAPVVIVYPWAAPEGCRCEGGMPVMQAADTNAIEIAAAVAPRPQLIISVGNDPTRDFPSAGVPFVERAYELYGRGELFQHLHLQDENHDFGPSKRNAVYAFFANHLDMTLLDEQTATIVIEQPQQMEVFNQDHPRPEHAVSGSAEVEAAFKRLTSRSPK